MLALVLAALTIQTEPVKHLDLRPRFRLEAPLPTVPGMMLDDYVTGCGVAEELAKAHGLQARILWIDGTANIERYNSEQKIEDLTKQIASSGFNTIVFDVKPISGQVLYPSKIAPKLTEWKGQRLPVDFDPLAIFIREAKKQRLSLLVSLNAFSEGHQLFRVGPGYSKPDQQTVLYEPISILRAPSGKTMPLAIDAVNPSNTEVGVYTNSRKAPPPKTDSFAIAVDANGRALEGLKSGTILYGTGAAAEFLRQTGSRLQFDTSPRFVPIGERPKRQYPLMMNPNDPRVQDYALSIVREIASRYAVDGFIYDDRLRYSGIDGDFSPVTRSLFEKAVNKPLNWPDDVFKFTLTPQLQRGIQPGPYYSAWMAWRAAQLRLFLQKVRGVLHESRPGAMLGVYAGSWYGEYPLLGSNYASPNLKAGFWFLTPDYRRAGFAPLLDFLITGCYYSTASVYTAMCSGASIGSTIEAAGALSNNVVRDECWTYAGISLDSFRNDQEGLQRALQAACASTQGVMVFDLSHDIAPMWPVFAQAFHQKQQAPHEHPEVLRAVRERRAILDRLGQPAPTVIVSAGSTGVGQ